MVGFLVGIGKDFQAVITINEYVSMATKLILGLGLCFEMPILVFFLARLGIVSERWLLAKFKYAVLIIFIIAAVITPTPDIATQCVFAFPMIALYLLGIGVAWMFRKRGAGRAEPLGAAAVRRPLRFRISSMNSRTAPCPPGLFEHDRRRRGARRARRRRGRRRSPSPRTSGCRARRRRSTAVSARGEPEPAPHRLEARALVPDALVAEAARRARGRAAPWPATCGPRSSRA